MTKVLLALVLGICLTVDAFAQPRKFDFNRGDGALTSAIQKWADSQVGKEVWLKVDVVTVQYGLDRTDATNILADGSVSYRGRVGGDIVNLMRQTQSSTAEGFAESINLKSAGQARVLKRGTKVVLDGIEGVDSDHIRVDFKEMGGSEYGIHLKFETDYKEADVIAAMGLAFANDLADALGQAIKLVLGMSVEEVVSRKGVPITEIDLGEKQLLIYDEVKLVFKNGKLVDAR